VLLQAMNDLTILPGSNGLDLRPDDDLARSAAHRFFASGPDLYEVCELAGISGPQLRELYHSGELIDRYLESKLKLTLHPAHRGLRT
jgi:hypothetical protein